jgi:hypothetical protein
VPLPQASAYHTVPSANAKCTPCSEVNRGQDREHVAKQPVRGSGVLANKSTMVDHSTRRVKILGMASNQQ